MDKRTLIFAITLSLSLLGINMFFDWQNQGNKQAWIEQQKALKAQSIERLKSEIATKNKIPLDAVLLYSDREMTKPLAPAVVDGNNLLFITPAPFEHKELFTKENGKSLIVQPVFISEEGFAVYGKEPGEALKIFQYKEFGHYDLLLLIPKESNQGFEVFNAELTDGAFSIPQAKLDLLLKDEKDYTPKFRERKGIVLAKSEDKLLPLGLFNRLDQPLEYFDDVSGLKKETAQETIESKEEKKEQQFYVLENETVQLVISTIGGAASEINLPFQSKQNTVSAVKSIEVDRDLLADAPQNARFPLNAALTFSKEGAPKAFERAKGGYYPLIRRDLVHKDNKLERIASKYYAFNIVSEYPEVAELHYKVKELTENSIVLEASSGHRKITKSYTLSKPDAPYTFTLKIDIQGDSRGLWLTSGVPEAELVSSSPAPNLQYRLTKSGKPEVINIDLPKDAINVTTVSPDWVSNSNAFFGIIMDPLKPIEPGFKALYVPGKDAPSRLTLIGEEFERYKVADLPGYMTLLPLNARGGSMEFRFFAGPYSTPVLKQVDAAFSDPATGYTPDYIACQTFHGWFAFISEPFAKFLFFLMNFFHSITGSWGFSIILLTVALRVMLYPLNAWSTKSMLKMQQIAPKVQEIQQKYKNDQKKAQLEIMNLYRESGANPFSGCLPLLVQMPFLIGMFDLLKSSFQLRGASFIPGWIDNLTSPDVLFSWKTPIPLIGNEFHLLPIFLGLIMLIQPQIMSSLPKDKSLWTEQQRQQKTMGTMMAVIFTWMFYNFPSGLNIYWISSMLLGMAQQWWMQKRMKSQPVPVLVEGGKKKK